MGQACCEPTNLDMQSKIPAMEQQYKDKRLPHPKADDYKSPFEKEFFMVVNLLRENPVSFSKYIKEFVASGKAPGHPSVANALDKILKATPMLDPVQLDGLAANACFVNLSKNAGSSADEITDGASKEYMKTANVS